MNVVFFYQHFWPDTPPYASLLRTIGESLVHEGSNVHVVTGHPSYKRVDRESNASSNELINSVSVQRLGSLWGIKRFTVVRLLQKVLFPIRAMFALIVRRYIAKKKIDVIIAATIPPIFNGLFAWLAASLVGAKFVYHLQDIYPEIGATSGLWKERSLVARVLKNLDTFVCKRASLCVVLSDDMKASLTKRGVSADSIVVINNFLLDTHQEPKSVVAEPITITTDDIHVVFAGNLGKFQGLDYVLEGFLHWQNTHANLPRKNMHLHFLGEGSEKDSLLKKANGNTNVHFHEHRPFSAAAQFIKSCDAGIVSLNLGVYQYAFPSKILTYLGLGVPLFALVEAHSEIAQELNAYELGVVCGDQSPEAVAAAFESLYQSVTLGQFDTARILNHYQTHLASDVALLKWKELVEAVSPKLSIEAKPL